MKWYKRISLHFIWYDFWIGAYWDSEGRWLYVCLLPMCVIKIDLGHYVTKEMLTRIGKRVDEMFPHSEWRVRGLRGDGTVTSKPEVTVEGFGCRTPREEEEK
jgi:hypothetical protein